MKKLIIRANDITHWGKVLCNLYIKTQKTKDKQYPITKIQ
jgi:hypothetical protein